MENDNLFVGVLWSLILWLVFLSSLKLLGVITVSWWIVLLPLWLPVVGFASLVGICLLAYLIAVWGGSGQ